MGQSGASQEMEAAQWVKQGKFKLRYQETPYGLPGPRKGPHGRTDVERGSDLVREVLVAGRFVWPGWSWSAVARPGRPSGLQG